MSEELRKVLTKWAIALVVGIIIAIATKSFPAMYFGASIVFGFSYIIAGARNVGWLGTIIDSFLGGGSIGTVLGMVLGFGIGSFVGPFIGIYELIIAISANNN